MAAESRGNAFPTQGCGSPFIGFGSGSSILGLIPIQIQGFGDQKLKKFIAEKKEILLDQKLQFTYPWASIKDVQVTEEAVSSQKRISSTSKHEISYFFLLLWVIFAVYYSYT
jgi:hypothetical protein